jgi:hypothetical protein
VSACIEFGVAGIGMFPRMLAIRSDTDRAGAPIG